MYIVLDEYKYIFHSFYSYSIDLTLLNYLFQLLLNSKCSLLVLCAH